MIKTPQTELVKRGIGCWFQSKLKRMESNGSMWPIGYYSPYFPPKYKVELYNSKA